MISSFVIALLAANTILVVMAVVRVILEKLQPYKAMFWIMLITFVPVLGLLLFSFFGKNLHKKRILNRRHNGGMSPSTYPLGTSRPFRLMPTRYERVTQIFAMTGHTAPSASNHVHIFTEGAAFFLDLLQEIGRATHHIHLMTYVFTDDALGQLIADALIDRAREGIEVRVIYDDVGSWKSRDRFFDRMRRGGVAVHAFLPVRFPAFTGKVNYRNHRKICVIDGRVGYIGGMNIALRYARGRRGHDWCDTHLRIEGGVVGSLQRTFLDDWRIMHHATVAGPPYYPEPPIYEDGCMAQVALSTPLLPWHMLMQGYVSIIYDARKYVYIETPYFIPTESVLLALCTAALAGVDVRILLPEHTDIWFVEHAARSYVDKAFEAGVKFYLYTPGVNHSKMLICDDAVCSCGSTNIDFRSFENNCESNLFIYDRSMALRMKRVFLGDLTYSTSLADNALFHHRTMTQRICDGIIRLFSPLM